ncbi:hypothetical protein ACGGAI_20540 [Streptomyces antibioticus]|uniref:hypothetical protein n=1 Tax=Streptomyces antibioticus TaxID=1890 RepID=UPI003722E414
MKPTRAATSENISVSVPTELVNELRSRTSRRWLSGCFTEAVRHQLAVDKLAEIVTSHEEEHGAFTEEEIEVARRELLGEVHAGDIEQDAG